MENNEEIIIKYNKLKEQQKKAHKTYYEKNKQKLSDKNYIYIKNKREINPEFKEKIKEQRKKYYEKNKDKILQQKKEYYNKKKLEKNI